MTNCWGREGQREHRNQKYPDASHQATEIYPNPKKPTPNGVQCTRPNLNPVISLGIPTTKEAGAPVYLHSRLQDVQRRERVICLTKEEFINAIDNNSIVLCSCIEERNAVLELLIEYGYEIGHVSLAHLMHENDDSEYLCPGFSGMGRVIGCYTTKANKNKIEFREVSHLIGDLVQNDSTDDEFLDSVMKLFAG